MTAVKWLDEQLQDTMYFVYGYTDGVRKVTIPLEDYMRLKQVALEMEKEQIKDAYKFGLSDEYVIGSDKYYNETYGSKGSDVTSSQTEISDEIWLSIDGRKLMANKPIEISDEEIEKGAENAWSDYEYEEGNLYSTTFKGGWKLAIKWYREQLKNKQ